MTLSDIAALAGVSVSTVSKAFSGNKDVSDKVREEIFTLAKRLGCFEKYYKGPREKYIIAIICPENESEYYSNIAGGLEHAFSDRGVDVVIATSRFDINKEQRIFSDGVPLFAVNSYDMNVHNADSAPINWQEGIDEAVEYLSSMGHSRIGYIGEPITRCKYDCFVKAMQARGLTVNKELCYISSSRFMTAGREGMKSFIDRNRLPTAIICAYDYIALGAMEYAMSAGLSVPRDISFIGFDDTATASLSSPPLTTIRANTKEAFPHIVELIIKRIDNKFYRMRDRLEIGTTLIKRGSVADITK